MNALVILAAAVPAAAIEYGAITLGHVPTLMGVALGAAIALALAGALMLRYGRSALS